MALQTAIIESNVGVGFPEAYARITDLFGNKDNLQVHIAIHASAAARMAGAVAVRAEAFYIPVADLPSTEALMPGLYGWLKTHVPVFQGAIDV